MTRSVSPIFAVLAPEPTSAQRRLLDDQQGFAGVLSRARDEGASDKDTPREAAEKLVAVAFVQPVLAKMRESTQAAAPFQPNQAERSFRAMMDSALAQKVVKCSRWSLVDRIEEKLSGTAGASALDALRRARAEPARIPGAAASTPSPGALA